MLAMDDKPDTRHRFRGLRKVVIMLLPVGMAFALLWRYAGLQLVEARADASATRDPDAFRVPPGFQAVSEEREPYSGSGWAKEIMHSNSGIVMVFIPPGMGTVTIREENERGKFAIPRPVKIAKGFYLGKYEVTQLKWSETMHYSPSKFYQFGLLTRPVESVSWDDCQKFCQTLGDGFRLPTEAEWEYACRAGTTTTYHYGASLDAKLANFFHTYPDGDPGKDGYHGATLPVGQYLPNLWGLYDMHGNVAEWCQDPFGKFPGYKRPASPSSDPDWFRVTRGGSWGSEASDCASECRSWCGQDQRSGSVGFRVARTAM